MTKEELLQLINIKLPDINVKKITAKDVRECFKFIVYKMPDGDFKYTNPNPSNFAVGGIPFNSSFDNIGLKDLFDWMFYGRDDKRDTEIRFTIKTTRNNEKVPIALLRFADGNGVANINFGDGKRETIKTENYNGSEKWVDSQGQTHYVDTGNTFYHSYENPGEYEVEIKASSKIDYVRFCESLIQGTDGYMKPSENRYITDFVTFRSDSLSNLDYTFAGLVNANVAGGFKLETPEVLYMTASFYGFGEARMFRAFPSDILSQIIKPTSLKGTFCKSGLRMILPAFFDSLVNLESAWECFKNSKLGYKHYEGVWKDDYLKYIEEGDTSKTCDFYPVSLFWKCPKLKDISHFFNYIGEGDFGQNGGYPRLFILKREFFWNGKSVGNGAGTIENAFYAFAKINRIIFEPNILKHAPKMVHLGGIFTQSHYTTHAVEWWGMLKVAVDENTVYDKESGFSQKVLGQGYTFDLRVMFPAASYPNIKTLNGAFALKVPDRIYGVNHFIDYFPQFNANYLFDQSFHTAEFLAKFPNAKLSSVDDYTQSILGQTVGTEGDKTDGRNGVFYLLDQDTRIKDKHQVPSLIFNNAIPY